MAGIKQALQDVLGQVTALTAPAGGSLFSYVRVFNDHFTRLERGEIEAFPLPCALIEIIRPLDFVPIGVGLEQADVTWRIHIGMEQLDAQDGTMEQNLDIFDQFRDILVAGLSGFKPTACGSLFRTAEEPDYTHTNVYHYIVDFKCGFIDSKGSPYDAASGQYIYTTPPIGIEIDVTE